MRRTYATAAIRRAIRSQFKPEGQTQQKAETSVKERERVRCENADGVLADEHVGQYFRPDQLAGMGLIEGAELSRLGWKRVQVRRAYGSFILERREPAGMPRPTAPMRPFSRKTSHLKREMAKDFHLEVRLEDSECQDCILFYPELEPDGEKHRSQVGDHIIVQFKASEEMKLDPTNGTGVCNDANKARYLKVTGACLIDQPSTVTGAPTRFQVRWHNQKRLYFYRSAAIGKFGVVFGKWIKFTPATRLIDQKHYKLTLGEVWRMP
jgi:hypothetical protein